MDWVSAGTGGDSPQGGGRGRGGSGGASAGAFTAPRESEEDARRLQQLTAEARTPSAHLTIVEAPDAITITDDHGQARTFRPDGRDAVIQLGDLPVEVAAKRDGGRLVVLYKVEDGRDLRYTYSRVASPPQLVVEVQFLERGRGDVVRRVYEPSGATETEVPAVTDARKAVAPASADRAPAQTVDQRPDADLKGLTKLGVVVEGLGTQAVACGLNQSTLEAAVSKRLTDAGFTVLRNSDEDTYLYVNVITASVSTGLCVSRYDVTLYTQTTATLSYHEAPVPVQVSLLHKGGIAGGASATHGADVLRGVQEYVDQFATRIRDANK